MTLGNPDEALDFSRIWELSRDLICTASFDGQFQHVNPGFERLLGYTPADLLERPFVEFVHPDDRDRTLAETGRLAGGVETAGFENRYRRKDGSYVWLRWNARSSADDRLIYAIAHDVTDLKESERKREAVNRELVRANRELEALRDAQLRRAEERYRLIVETSGEGVWLLDEKGMTTFVNRQMCELLGYREEDLIGRPPVMFMVEDERERAQETFARVREGARGLFEFTLVRRDGTHANVLVSATSVNEEDGSFAGSLGMVTDITERKRLEGQLLHSEKIEAIGRFTGGIAHDFNNMLLAIRGFVELAAAQLDTVAPGEDGRQLRESIASVSEATEHATALARKLLAFSRNQQLETLVLDLNDIVVDAEDLLRRVIGAGVEMEVMRAGEPCPVELDRGQMENALVNLAINAQHAMPGGGKLTIAVESVEIGGRPYARLSVADTGVGMDDATRSRIFEPYFTTKGDEGTGLGLPTVYGFVTQSGGTIIVDSEPGRGTRFIILLPLVQG